MVLEENLIKGLGRLNIYPPFKTHEVIRVSVLGAIFRHVLCRTLENLDLSFETEIKEFKDGYEFRI